MRFLAATLLMIGSLAALPATAADTTPTPAEALENARAMVKAKRWAAAIGELSQLTTLAPSADVYNLLAFSQRNSGDYTNALPNYFKALALDPNHKGAHEYLGELYVKQGEMAKARALLDRLATLCPQGCEERDDLARAIRDAGG